jgi:hypothetical protein
MDGVVTSYLGITLILNVTATVGSGTFNSWRFSNIDTPASGFTTNDVLTLVVPSGFTGDSGILAAQLQVNAVDNNDTGIGCPVIIPAGSPYPKQPGSYSVAPPRTGVTLNCVSNGDSTCGQITGPTGRLAKWDLIYTADSNGVLSLTGAALTSSGLLYAQGAILQVAGGTLESGGLPSQLVVNQVNKGGCPVPAPPMILPTGNAAGGSYVQLPTNPVPLCTDNVTNPATVHPPPCLSQASGSTGINLKVDMNWVRGTVTTTIGGTDMTVLPVNDLTQIAAVPLPSSGKPADPRINCAPKGSGNTVLNNVGAAFTGVVSGSPGAFITLNASSVTGFIRNGSSLPAPSLGGASILSGSMITGGTAGGAGTYTVSDQGAAITAEPMFSGINCPYSVSTLPSPGAISLSNPPLDTGFALSNVAALDNGILTPTGTITFTLLDPSGTTIYSETATVNGNGYYTLLGTACGTPPCGNVLTPSSPTGAYQWVVSYGGDGNNAATQDPEPNPTPPPTYPAGNGGIVTVSP